MLHEQTGLRVDGANSDAVSQALALMLSDDEMRHHLAETAEARARAEMGWEAVAEKTANLLLTDREEV